VAVYAICGMMALTSPVIGAPLTTILIVFELTRNYDITIAAMVAVVFSNLVAHRFFGRSLFDVQLARRGADLSAGRDQARLAAIRVRDYCTADMITGSTDDDIGRLRRALARSDWSEAYITSPEGAFLGTLQESAEGDEWNNVLRRPALQFDEETTVMQAMQALPGFVGDAIPVVHSRSGRLIGVVSEAAVIEAYLDVSNALRREENAVL
jgi:CIC family chloride channel protein